MTSSSVLRIQGPQTIRGVEQELDSLNEGKYERLLLPVKPHRWWIGGEAALIQLLATWGTRQSRATLITHIKEDEDPATQLGRLVRRPFGFVASSMAQRVTDLTQTRSLKVAANSESDRIIDGMWGRLDDPQRTLWDNADDDEPAETPVAASGGKVFFAAVDHHPRWRIPQFYFPSGEVRHRDDFVLVGRRVTDLAMRMRGESPIPPDLMRPIGAILHELIKNTHDWARWDARNFPLARSVRGLLVQGYSLGEGEVESVVAEDPPLRRFFNHAECRTASGRYRLLEISVFDCGSGLAARWLGRELADDVELAEEYRACLACLHKHGTTSGQSHRGLGLDEVARTISGLGGFLRLRTGRLSLFRDFVAHPYESANKTSEDLSDWSTSDSDLTQRSPVAGTLYTLLLPVKAS